MSNEHTKAIIKGKRYADEPNRIVWLTTNEVQFKGNHHNDHRLSRQTNGHWKCDCATFTRLNRWLRGNGMCSHTYAIEKLEARLISAEPLVT